MNDAKENKKSHAPHHGNHPGKQENPEMKDMNPEGVTLDTLVYEELQEQLKKAEQGCASNLDGWQRERAEFSNYKKRVEREQVQLSQVITGNIIKKYLVILDDLELALKARPKDGEGAAWSSGIELVARKILSIIESEGVTSISENRVQFDPTIHEAISNEENPEFESGEVIEVVRTGYKINDRVIRPAVVRVAR